MRQRFWVLMLSLCLAMLAAAGCGGANSGPPRVVSLALTTQIDPTTKAPQDAVEQFPQNTKVMYVSVRIDNPRKGTEVEAKWYYDSQGKGQFGLVDSSKVTFPDGKKRYAAFSLTAADQFPAGSYKVAILVDGQVAQEKVFIVR